MRYLKNILAFFLVLSFIPSFSQDVAITQFYMMPTQLNPAYTGLMDQYVRISTNYRTQWSKFAPYYSYSAGVDGAIIDNKQGGGDFFGLGILATHDQPDSGLTTSMLSLSGAFHKQIKELPRHNLIFGLRLSAGQRMLDNRNLWYGTFWEENNNYDPMMTSDYERISIVDLSAGIMYSMVSKDKYNINFGIAIDHITKPNLAFLSSHEDKLYRKMGIHFNADQILLNVDNRNNAWGVAPKFLFETQGPSKRMSIGNLFKYIMNLDNKISVSLGGMYRGSNNYDDVFRGESMAFIAQFEYNNVFFGYSHDFNTINFKNLFGEVHGNELSIIINFASY